jgi:hypothetical protein
MEWTVSFSSGDTSSLSFAAHGRDTAISKSGDKPTVQSIGDLVGQPLFCHPQ